ncbi:unnamed protein product [Mytilus edulis]|uniref:Uncharacterized protein n=1 Tax=Mytilus edulis TaxID=6550 RepID=A0A8S3UPQ5_MYTED|nr:unnamed protein product [Mytilus edulis]
MASWDGNEVLKIIKIDTDMSKIDTEYPSNCLPIKLNKRTGKAKKCQFEAIDVICNEESAHMITFHTSVNRIQPWIKALSLLYFDNMGNQKDNVIKWSDVPERWSDRHDVANSILIEIRDPSEHILKYNVTFFVTTGTIRVQGSNYLSFVEKDFPILIEIMKLLDTCENDETPLKTIEGREPNEVVTQQTINDRVMTVSEKQTKTDANNINEEKSEVSQNLKPTNPKIDNNNNAADTPSQTEVNLSRLQQCFLDTICKLQISQEKDTTTIVEAVNGCKILLLQGQSQLDQKSTDKDTLSKELQSVQQKIKTLQEEKDSLKSQLQIE